MEVIKTGTTIVALRFDEGVILAADSRTSAGSYVVSRVTNKIKQLSDRIYCCVSGVASQTQTVASYAEIYSKKLAIENERMPSVLDAAKVTSLLISRYGLRAGMILAGVDENGPALYSIKLGGSIIKENVFIGGSGSAFIYGYLDAVYRENMSFEEKKQLARDLVKLAIQRDNASGGCIRMTIIKRDDVEKIFIPGNEI